ncbi:MAG: hypothetical protein ACKO8G_08320 [Actinomycetota bacterium]
MSWVLLGAQVAEAAPASFGASEGVPLRIDYTLSSKVCDSTSSSITLGADAVFLEGLGMRAKFSNNQFDTKTTNAEGAVDASIVPEGGSVSAPKKGVADYGAGGNPWIMVRFPVNGVYPSGDEGWIAVGRCVQGLNYGLSKRVDLAGLQTGLLGAASCGKTGSTINVNGVNDPDGGIDIQIRFQNSLTNPQQKSNNGNGYLVTSFPDGSLTKAKGWGAGGAGGNPFISAWFVKWSDKSQIGSASAMKRCKDLM